MPSLERLRIRVPLVLLAVGLVVLTAAGCGGTNQQNPAAAAGPGQSIALADVLDKLQLIAKDECETHPAAMVYRGCTRFLTELNNALNSVRSESAGLPQAASINGVVNEITAAIGDFTKRGCAPPPGQPPTSSGPADPTCVVDFSRIQAGLRQLIATLSPVVSHSAAPS